MNWYEGYLIGKIVAAIGSAQARLRVSTCVVPLARHCVRSCGH